MGDAPTPVVDGHSAASRSKAMGMRHAGDADRFHGKGVTFAAADDAAATAHKQRVRSVDRTHEDDDDDGDDGDDDSHDAHMAMDTEAVHEEEEGAHDLDAVWRMLEPSEVDALLVGGKITGNREADMANISKYIRHRARKQGRRGAGRHHREKHEADMEQAPEHQHCVQGAGTKRLVKNPGRTCNDDDRMHDARCAGNAPRVGVRARDVLMQGCCEAGEKEGAGDAESGVDEAMLASLNAKCMLLPDTLRIHGA